MNRAFPKFYLFSKMIDSEQHVTKRNNKYEHMKSTLLVLCAALFTFLTSAQTEITGTVSDDLGQLPLVNITIKNSKTGTSSNDNGRFFIEAKSTDTLQFSYLGYKTKEVVVGEQTKIDFVFETYEELNEVVINAYAGGTYCSRLSCGVSWVEVTSVNSRQSNSKTIKLYPNPSKDGIFNIKLLEDVSKVKIIVADLTGRIILDRAESKLNSNFVVDLSNQPTGIYIINVSSNGTQIASKKAIRI